MVMDGTLSMIPMNLQGRGGMMGVDVVADVKMTKRSFVGVDSTDSNFETPNR